MMNIWKYLPHKHCWHTIKPEWKQEGIGRMSVAIQGTVSAHKCCKCGKLVYGNIFELRIGCNRKVV